MTFVYLLRSIKFPREHYVGLTKSVGKRIRQHNGGVSPHTAKFLPWELIMFLGFANEGAALRFEKYLKSGSGREFARRHFRA